MFATLQHVTKTCPCNVYPLKPHFYIVKLGYAGVYLFFLFWLQNIDSGYSLEPPRPRSNTANLGPVTGLIRNNLINNIIVTLDASKDRRIHEVNLCEMPQIFPFYFGCTLCNYLYCHNLNILSSATCTK